MLTIKIRKSILLFSSQREVRKMKRFFKRLALLFGYLGSCFAAEYFLASVIPQGLAAIIITVLAVVFWIYSVRKITLILSEGITGAKITNKSFFENTVTIKFAVTSDIEGISGNYRFEECGTAKTFKLFIDHQNPEDLSLWIQPKRRVNPSKLRKVEHP